MEAEIGESRELRIAGRVNYRLFYLFPREFIFYLNNLRIVETILVASRPKEAA